VSSCDKGIDAQGRKKCPEVKWRKGALGGKKDNYVCLFRGGRVGSWAMDKASHTTGVKLDAKKHTQKTGNMVNQ